MPRRDRRAALPAALLTALAADPQACGEWATVVADIAAQYTQADWPARSTQDPAARTRPRPDTTDHPPWDNPDDDSPSCNGHRPSQTPHPSPHRQMPTSRPRSIRSG